MANPAHDFSGKSHDFEAFAHAASGCHVLVCTATREEYNGVVKLYTDLYEHDGKVLAQPWQNGTVWLKDFNQAHGEGRKLKIAVVHLGKGLETAGIAATGLFMRVQPLTAIMVGVCASDSISEGKTVFGTAAFNYEAGKWEVDEQKQPVFRSRISEWKAKAGSSLEGFGDAFFKGSTEVKYPVIFASGSAVRTDSPDILRRASEGFNDKVKALDMEASAFLEACHVCGVVALGVIKTVLDPMNQLKKDQDTFYQYYTEKAARFASLYFLDYWTSGEDPDMEHKLGKTLAQSYFKHFLQPVMIRINNKLVLDREGQHVNADRPFQVLVPTEAADLGDTTNRWRDKVEAAESDLDDRQYVVAFPPPGTTYRPLTMIYFNKKYRDYPTTLGSLDDHSIYGKSEALESFLKTLLNLTTQLRRDGKVEIADWKTLTPVPGS